MEHKPEKLLSEFPPVSISQWEAQIQKDLKGADYDKKLIWKTLEGFSVKPYYTAEDIENIEWLKAFPGEFPYIRGNKKKSNHWLVRQEMKVDDIKKTNEKALEILMKGVDSLGFELDCKKKYNIDDIELLLKNIRADIAEINFTHTPQQLEIVNMMTALVRKYNRPLDKITGSVTFDPLVHFARYGRWYENEENDFDYAFQLIRAAQTLPHFRVIAINGEIFANAGASIVQEMAFSLCAGSEYLSRLIKRGLMVDDVAPKIKFNLAVGSNYFMEIAKLRAYRLLWAHIVNAFGLNDANNGKMNIHGKNATWNFTVYDAYVNMLRTTTGTMSALLGGVDSFTVMPFDIAYEQPTEFAERIARNQQLVLKEESYLDKVADPAAGSYYIEYLTQSLVEHAWKLFLQLNDEGGFVAALRNNTIQDAIKNNAKQRNLHIATRKEIILGTNQYPNFGESFAHTLPSSVFEVQDKTSQDAEIETIKTYRAAQNFERMRYQTDVYSLQSKRPNVWMLSFGNLAMRKARANFAANFFACAGFEVIDNGGFDTAEEGIAAARQIQPEIVVICSADEAYVEKAAIIFEALKNDAIVVLAGYPTDLVEQLKAAGMKHFVHVKSNVLETLTLIQKELGIIS